MGKADLSALHTGEEPKSEVVQDVIALLRLENSPLRPTEKFVLLVLAYHAGPDRRCSLPQAHIARRVGRTERTVRRAIKRLEELGVVEVERVPGQSPTYRLRLDRLGIGEGGAS